MRSWAELGKYVEDGILTHLITPARLKLIKAKDLDAMVGGAVSTTSTKGALAASEINVSASRKGPHALIEAVVGEGEKQIG